jgi:hypothetical protein
MATVGYLVRYTRRWLNLSSYHLTATEGRAMETKLYSIDVTARGIGYEAKIRAGVTGAGGVLATGIHENDPATQEQAIP